MYSANWHSTIFEKISSTSSVKINLTKTFGGGLDVTDVKGPISLAWKTVGNFNF